MDLDFSFSPVAFLFYLNIPDMLSTEDILSLTLDLPGLRFHQLFLLIYFTFISVSTLSCPLSFYAELLVFFPTQFFSIALSSSDMKYILLRCFLFTVLSLLECRLWSSFGLLIFCCIPRVIQYLLYDSINNLLYDWVNGFFHLGILWNLLRWIYF